MSKYTVIKPIQAEGRVAQAGDLVELSERQAKYLLLAGKVRVPGAKATSKATKAAGKKEN